MAITLGMFGADIKSDNFVSTDGQYCVPVCLAKSLQSRHVQLQHVQSAEPLFLKKKKKFIWFHLKFLSNWSHLQHRSIKISINSTQF